MGKRKPLDHFDVAAGVQFAWMDEERKRMLEDFKHGVPLERVCIEHGARLQQQLAEFARLCEGKG